MRRVALALGLSLAAFGIAVARGKKAEEPPLDPPPPEPAVSTGTSPPPAAPPLFAGGLPVTLPSLPAGLASLSAQGCNACHYAAHDTWSTSAHATAWANPRFQAAVKSAGTSTACVSCHLPIAAQQHELAAGYVDGDLTRPRLEPNPSFDATLRGEGVTCAACHVRGDAVLGTHEAPRSPHRVVVSAELGSSEMCATCHQLTWPDADRPFYDTYGEWKASAWAAAGVSCQDCHMAPTAGAVVPGTDGTVPSHALGADPRRALSVLVDLPSAVVQRGQALPVKLTVQNTGAGHSLPTGNPFKSATLSVELVDAAGKPLATPWTLTWSRSVEMAPPWKTTSDHRLAAGGQETATFQLLPSPKGAAGLGALDVHLVQSSETVLLTRLPVEIR
jgi:hypothetical protein